MKHFLFLLFLLLTSVVRAENGDWRIYASYQSAQQTVVLKNTVFVRCEGGVYSYALDDTSLHGFDKSNVLSDTGIFSILKSDETNEIVVVYTNGNIDIIEPNQTGGRSINLPDLKTKVLADKTINDAVIEEGWLYISTNSGLLCVDIKKRTFGNFYNLGKKVKSVAYCEGDLYVATDDGIYYGNTDLNLLDSSQWQRIASSNYSRLMKLGETIFALVPHGIDKIQSLQSFSNTRIATVPTATACIANDEIWIFNTATSATRLSLDAKASHGVSVTSIATPQQLSSVSFAGNVYWGTCTADGSLRGYRLDGEALVETVGSIMPNSPRRNASYHLSMEKGQRLLMTSGDFNYPQSGCPGTVMMYEKGDWSAFEEYKSDIFPTNYYLNLTDVVQDPLDPTHHYASSARCGLFEFRNGKIVNHFSEHNSPLTSILPESEYHRLTVRITGLAFDGQHNLWMLNNECDTIVRILLNNGKWTAYNIPELKDAPTFDRVVFDRRGWAWINSRRLVESWNAGFCVIDPKGNASNPKGFRHKFFPTFMNQDGTNYQPLLFHCVTEDVDGAMWLGCDRGIFVIYNPEDVFNSNFRVTQVKVPRNDGSNLADYLLNDVDVTCITIDGGNRKWVGTSNDGVYLISADGLEELQHFNTANSPLVHDCIYDIAIDGVTGEVFFATGDGLVSYMGDAIDPAPKYDNDLVEVYPNPVRPDYQGSIVIKGLKADTDVKIVNASGRIVNEGKSNGGEYVWNGRLPSGGRCGNGVYFILGSNAEGNDGVVGKFVVVRE